MEGDAHISKLPESWRHAIANTYFCSENNFKLLIPGKTQTSSREGFFGPEIGFAHYLQKESKPAYLIKYAKGGMPLDYGWDIRTGFDPTQWHSGPAKTNRINFYPGEHPNDSTKGILYQEMVDRFSDGLQHLHSQDYVPIIKGFLWMQGEQDTKVKVGANALRKKMAKAMESILQIGKKQQDAVNN